MDRPTNKLIRASAGTGKTYQLTNRYLQLLRAGEPIEQILATTFTRKAAGEILNRVLFRLAEAAVEPTKLVELADALDDESLTAADCRRMLPEACRHLHRLRIGTLDSFFAQLAGSYSLELGLPVGWRIVEEHVESSLRRQAVDRLLHGDSVSELMTLVHLLTKGETARSVSQLVNDLVANLHRLFIETTKDHWKQFPRRKTMDLAALSDAVESLRTIPLPTDKVWAKAHATNYEQAMTGQWSEFLTSGLAGKIAQDEETFNRKQIEAAVVDAYRPVIGHACAILMNQVADQTEGTYKILAKFDECYTELKRAERAVRFDDVAQRLAEASESPIVQETFRLDGRIAHLLLDEFQDTSRLQWQVLRPLAQRVTASPRTSLFCVGDTKQAIYGWRGGVAEIFDAVEHELPNIDPQPLNKSWRSSPIIIDATNAICEGVIRHDNLEDQAAAVKAWRQQFGHHETQRAELNGYAELIVAGDESPTGDAKDATLHAAACHVAELTRRAPQFEIGVLTRGNEAVRRLIFFLRDMGIDASEEGGNLLTDAAGTRIILSLMKLADHPGDMVALFHLAHSPLAEPLALTDHRDSIAAAKASARIRRELLTNGYGPTVARWSKPLVEFCNRREWNRLEQLTALAYNYQASATLRADDFLAFVESKKVADPLASRVRVMTIHQAKGLEFDIVVLPDLDHSLRGQPPQVVVGRDSPTGPVKQVYRYCNAELQAQLPAAAQKVFQDSLDREVQEAMCVLYVGITRAIHALHMFIKPAKTLSKTFAGLLRAALTDGQPVEPNTTVWQHGDPRWFENPGVIKKPLSADAARRDHEQPIHVRLAAPAGPRRRNLQRVSPSGLEGDGLVKLGEIFTKGRSTALVRGTLIHAWFEQIEWLDDGQPDDKRLAEIAREQLDVNLNEHDLSRAIADFRAMLDHDDIAAVLKRSNYHGAIEQKCDLVVENEFPISFRDHDLIIIGNIDRLVLIRRDASVIGADILDFKTDQLSDDPPNSLKTKVAYYRPQIETYRRAIASMFGLPPDTIVASLLFVGPGVHASM